MAIIGAVKFFARHALIDSNAMSADQLGYFIAMISQGREATEAELGGGR